MKSLSLIDASKAFTIAMCAFPTMATIVTVVVLGEAFIWLTVVGTDAMDAIVAAGIRIPVAATVLTLLMCCRRHGSFLEPSKHEPRTLAMVVVAGVLTYGVAAVGYVTAIQMIGAAKTVLVTTTPRHGIAVLDPVPQRKAWWRLRSRCCILHCRDMLRGHIGR